MCLEEEISTGNTLGTDATIEVGPAVRVEDTALPLDNIFQTNYSKHK